MTTFNLPDLGEGLPDAEIHEWYVKEGDEIKVDQPIVSMETAKAVVDVPSPYTGKVLKLHGQVGDIIQTGQPLITYALEENAPPLEKTIADSQSVDALSQVELKKSDLSQAISSEPVRAIPAVRALANQLKVDLTQVIGSGADGTITRADVERAAAGIVKPSSSSHAEPLRGSRRIMAQQMEKSHAEVVPVTLNDDANLQRWAPKTDVTLRIIQAVIAACQAEPRLNAYFYGQSIEICSSIHLGMAVDTPDGLYVPVLKDISHRSVDSLRAQLDEFKLKARNQSFSPEDLQGATITLSNFGTIAGRYATPVVVPPTVAIIATGKAKPMPVVMNDTVIACPVMPLSLTFDHRAATGGEAARFLRALIDSLES